MFLLRRAVNARYLISLHRTDFTPSNWATRVEFTAKLRNPKIYLQCDLNAVYHTCDTCSLHYSVTRCCILSYYWIYYATFRYCIRCTMNFLLRTKKKKIMHSGNITCEIKLTAVLLLSVQTRR